MGEPNLTRESSFLAPSDPPSPKYTGVTGNKTMKFTLYWIHPGQPEGAAIPETHEQVTTDPEKWSRDILDWFNSTLRPHERKRVFVRCDIIGEVPPAEHAWTKWSVMTKVMVGGARHGRMYDAMKCERCGVTGKRFGIKEHVHLDSKYRLALYRRCDLTMQFQHQQKVTT